MKFKSKLEQLQLELLNSEIKINPFCCTYLGYVDELGEM